MDTMQIKLQTDLNTMPITRTLKGNPSLFEYCIGNECCIITAPNFEKTLILRSKYDRACIGISAGFRVIKTLLNSDTVDIMTNTIVGIVNEKAMLREDGKFSIHLSKDKLTGEIDILTTCKVIDDTHLENVVKIALLKTTYSDIGYLPTYAVSKLNREISTHDEESLLLTINSKEELSLLSDYMELWDLNLFSKAVVLCEKVKTMFPMKVYKSNKSEANDIIINDFKLKYGVNILYYLMWKNIAYQSVCINIEDKGVHAVAI